MPSVNQFMTRDVLTVEASTSALEAARKMRERGVSSLVVLDKESPIGIITERDFLRKLVCEDRRPSEVRVSEIMSSPLISVEPERDLADAARLMLKMRTRRLVVVKEGKVIGILTTTDIVRSLMR